MLHIWSAVKLTQENAAARPVGYVGDPVPPVASYASRTMLMSGLIILTFIIYHLLHFTVQARSVNFTGWDFHSLHETARDGSMRHDVYRMMVLGFSRPVVSGFYLLAMFLLCLHLGHGVSAMFQSLGLKNKAWGPRIDCFSRGAAWVIFAGYASIPLAVLFGLVK
ncbi:MAG: succinate dehydrogenase cytochrome b subunit [Verrucomicrobia bacterium]|nr:succinate dehydrogenase cytochrome b subunit [Verrucomicrobiota bacterium]